MAEMGFTFAPMTGSPQGSQGPTRGAQTPVAIRSLELPTRQSPTQLAPLSLLGAQGGAGIPMAELLRLLMSAFAPMQQSGGAMSGAGPMPMGSAPQASPLSALPQSLAPRVAFDHRQQGKATPISMNFGASYGNDDRESPGGSLAPPASLLPLPSYTPSQVSPSQRGADNVQFEYGRATPIKMNFGPSNDEPPQPSYTPRVLFNSAPEPFDVSSLMRGPRFSEGY